MAQCRCCCSRAEGAQLTAEVTILAGRGGAQTKTQRKPRVEVCPEGGQGGSDAAAGAALGQEVPGRGLLQQGCEDVLQLRQAGAQRRAGQEGQLVGRVKGQDGEEPPAPRRAVC